jgi:nitric oxide reductase NorQ protein
MKTHPAKGLEQAIEQYALDKEPFYSPVGDEVELFRTAYAGRIPVMLKGPTGCGKTRFVQYMAYHLKRPLITVACHEDLTASDLVGRFLLKGNETVWVDGPLTLAVKFGGICYLDEVVEARKDTTVVIHPLTDTRRLLTIEKKSQVVEAVDPFMLVISYNPGYQSVLKELKQSTKQRFLSIEFNYPPPDLEKRIIMQEAQVPDATADNLVRIGGKVRNLKHHGLEEGVSTRLLIYAGQMIRQGIAPQAACRAAVIEPLTDDAEMQQSIAEIVASIL